MTPMDLLNVLKKTPFEPFRIHISDGTVYDIRHPELVMPGLTTVIVGIPTESGLPNVYGTYETVALNHIVRLEPIAQSTSAT